MEEFKGKWCISITRENVDYLKKHLKCGAGYLIGQTIFFNETGIRRNGYDQISWNMDYNNKCCNMQYIPQFF